MEMSLIINQHCQRDSDKAESCPTSRVFFNRSRCLSSPVPPVDGPGPLNQRPPHRSLPPSWLVQISPKMPVGQWAVSLGVSPSLLSQSDWMKSWEEEEKDNEEHLLLFLMWITATFIYSPQRHTSHFTFMVFFLFLLFCQPFFGQFCI